MSDQLPPCPACASEYTYETGGLLTCPMCAHEWTAGDAAEQDSAAGSGSGSGSGSGAEQDAPILDSVGNPLADGDTVTIVKGLKVKGGGALKSGTQVRGIRLVPGGPDGHDIEARIPGTGQMMLKSSVVKKVK